MTPKGKGLCPRCSRFLKHSFAARRHPVNKFRAQQLLDKLVADYQPQNTMQHAACEHLAATLEQLEVLKAGSQEHKRLVELSQLLALRLDEAHAAHAARTPTDNDLADLSDEQLIERAEALLNYARETKELNERVGRAVAEDTARWQQRATAPPNEGRDDTQPAAPAAEPAPEPRIAQTHERKEEDAAAIRRKLGWDEGVWNEQTGYRFRE